MMKRFLQFALVSILFASCIEENLKESSAVASDADSRSTIRIGLEDNSTRIQMNELQKTVWTKNDCVSVFYLSDANEKWQYKGETGERVGDFERVSNGNVTETTEKVVIVYPFNENYDIDTETYDVRAFLPAAQTYLKDSYGLDGTIMISQGDQSQSALKSVCGWLKLQLTGKGEKVNSISLRGNNGEQVAGELYINSLDATSILASQKDDIPEDGDETTGDTVLKEVTLNCPDGVVLGSESTDFYIALPPQTFSKGLIVDVNCEGGVQYCKYTQKSITIDRNTIQPFTSIDTNEDMDIMDPNLPPYDEIWYTSTSGSVVPLLSTSGFGANVVSNTYEDGKGVIKFDGIVTAIGDYAYNNDYSPNTSLKSVTIPTTVKSIGKLAFRYCTKLESINLHDGITHIGERAFIYTNLSEITIPKGLTELSKQVFDSTPLKSIVIPDNIKKIGERAFCLCSDLETIVIGDGVTEIELCAFEIWTSSVKSVTLGKNVETMGLNVFDGCTGTLTITGNIPVTPSDSYSNSNAWIFGADFSEIIIGDEVQAIPDYAFNSTNLPLLTRITIGRGVKSIGERVFWNGIQQVNIKDLRSYCQIDFSDSILDGAALYINDNPATSVTIPDGITEIRPYTFMGCSNLNYLTIPDSVTIIGDYAFYGCASLRSVNQAQKIRIIGNYAFMDCSSLFYMPVTSSLASIGNYAFYDCTELSLSTSPSNVKAIGDSAFYMCKNLNSTLNIKNALSIGESVFYGCSGMNTVDLRSATTVGQRSFYGCSNLKSVVLNDNLTRIESSTFCYTSLESVVLPEYLQYIGESAFRSCKLNSVTIPKGVTYIDCYAFEYNANLSSVYCMPATPPEVGTDYDDGDRYWDAFYGSAEGCILYVPNSSLDLYKSEKYWNSYANKMVGYQF